MNQLEQMAQMFAATDADGRRYVMVILKHEYERTQRGRRPTLRLIPGGQPVTSAPASACSAMLNKIKELR
jgi:hypothetical protein